MDESQFDAVVVGAGPAGCSAAIRLALKGVRTALVDRSVFPREKVCGDAVGGAGAAILHEYGLTQAIEKAEAIRLKGIIVVPPEGERMGWDLSSDGQEFESGFLLPRQDLDSLLAAAADEAGAIRVEGLRVTGPVIKDGVVSGVEGRRNGKHTVISAGVVVAADGAFSVLARSMRGGGGDRERTMLAVRAYACGIDPIEGGHLELYYDDTILPSYAWIFPLGAGRANIGFFASCRQMRRLGSTLSRAYFQFLQRCAPFRTRLERAHTMEPFRRGAMRLGPPDGPCVYAGMLVAGEAAPFTDPLIGEGISAALVTGRLAADAAGAALSAGDYSADGPLGEYERSWRRIVGPRLIESLQLKRTVLRNPSAVSFMWAPHGGMDTERRSSDDSVDRDQLALFDRYKDRNARVWKHLDAYLKQLTPSLFILWRKFERRMAAYSAKGHYREFFERPRHSFPALPLHWWIEEALGSKAGNARTEHLAFSTLILYFYLRIQDNLIDEDVEREDRQFLYLCNPFIRSFFTIYQEIFPSRSPFWRSFNAIWDEFSEVSAQEKTAGRTCSIKDAEVLRLGSKLLPGAIPAVAMAHMAGREDDAEALVEMSRWLGLGIQLMNDFFNWRTDLALGHETYFLDGLCRVQGQNLRDRMATIYQAMLKSPRLNDYLCRAIDAHRQAWNRVSHLGVGTFGSYIEYKIGLIDEMRKHIIRGQIEAAFGVAERIA